MSRDRILVIPPFRGAPVVFLRLAVDHSTARRLAQAMLAGDQQAFDRFFDGCFPGLYRFALARLGHDEDAAEEVAQVTVCKAIRKIATFDTPADALDRLPVRYGQALERKYLEGRSVREIARRLDLSDKAAEPLLTRSGNAFRDAFEALLGPVGLGGRATTEAGS